MRPTENTYPIYYENYISLVKQNNIKDALIDNEKESLAFFNSLSSDCGDFAYEKGKWTIKEVLNHLIDTERVFSYRALRFARNDGQLLPSYEQDHFVANSESNKRTLKDLIEEFISVRKATISLFCSLSEDALKRIGLTGAGKTTVIAIGFTICGHAIHHINVINARYLKK